MNLSQNPSSIRSKQKIQQAFLNLLNEFAYDQIYVKQILLDGNISRKTFYRNFDSKEDVLNSIIVSIIDKYLAKLQPLDIYSFSKLLNIIFPFCYNIKDFLLILRDNHLLFKVEVMLNQKILDQHKKIKKKIDDYSSMDDYVIYFNIGAIWNVITMWIENDAKDSEDQIKNVLSKYLNNIDSDLRLF